VRELTPLAFRARPWPGPEVLHELAWALAQPEPLQAPPGLGREPQLAEGMARALVPAQAPERAMEALRSKNSEGALALGLALGLRRAPALDRQAQGPDRPGLASTALPVAKAPRAEQFGPRRPWVREGWRGELLGTLACFACVWLLEARRAVC
jgi:hypothetical protein